ncbi:DUF4062 domain-containing protein [Novosphingobium sp.]|uniref:DUF4062 domain-containing protein n=1 Tax=Novosphingobium sp. TaxID=1874826 RepID=UPI003451CEE7
MAGLRVFVSSTCVDLSAQRAQVRTLLEQMGYEPIMSEHSDVLFDHRLHTHTSCGKEVNNADMIILLIGSRFGGAAVPDALSSIDFDEIAKESSKIDLITEKKKLSITQVEVMRAVELNIPLFAFVDSKVYSDHHLYQSNKDKSFVEEIFYPSIQKPQTAKYVFEFINFITHRTLNNAIIEYTNFDDISSHLIKQWSMTFQRLLRDEREKAVEGRRADILIEQIQDLKAAVIQSISVGSGRDIARSVLKYRRLIDFLLGMRMFKPQLDLIQFTGAFDDLLEEFGVTDFFADNSSAAFSSRMILIREDDTYVRARMPLRRFATLPVEWQNFSNLDEEIKAAVVHGIEDSEGMAYPVLTHVEEPYIHGGIEQVVLDNLAEEVTSEIAPPYWNEQRVRQLTVLWETGRNAAEIAEIMGGVSRNAVIGKAHRLGLRPRPAPTS